MEDVVRPCHKCLFETFGRCASYSYCTCGLAVPREAGGLPKVIDGVCSGFHARHITLTVGKEAWEAEKKREQAGS